MPYEYEKERPWLFTDDGQRMFIKVRDRAKYLSSTAGAMQIICLLQGMGGDSFKQLACVDRLIELEEFRRIDREQMTQYQVLVENVYRGR